MCGAGPRRMLELMAPVPAADGTGGRRKGTVMAGVKGSDARTVVAVIGVGIMGSAMARNLAAAGLDTSGTGRRP